MREILAKDWIELKIDQDRMTHGKELADELRKGVGGGIPWTVVLDADGKELAQSGGPGENFGCPVTDKERERFLAMLRATRNKVSDAELATIEEELIEYVQPILDAQRKARQEREERSKKRGEQNGGSGRG